MIIKEFNHQKGHHCVSTTTRDLIHHAGIPLSEEMVFGLDASIGFIYMDKDSENNLYSEGQDIPIFLGGLTGMISEDSLVCKILGLNIDMDRPSSSDLAWDSSREILDQGHPLGIQVEMGYLPYILDAEDEEFYFGGHVISLIGYDEEKRVAYVCDTDWEGHLEIQINQLKKARNSKRGTKWLQPHNMQYHISERPDGKKPPIARAIKLATQKAARNMIAASMNFQGIPGLNLMVKSIAKWEESLQGTIVTGLGDKKIPKAQFAFEMIYGFIEDFGTGGACFRNMYSDFLEELRTSEYILDGPHAWKKDELDLLEESKDLISESALEWTGFAEELKIAINEGGTKCLDFVDLEELAKKASNIARLEEAGFKTLFKIKL